MDLRVTKRKIQATLSASVVIFAGVIIFGLRVWKAEAAEYYDWSTRIDRDEEAAGIFEITPFPINQNTTSYTVKNDENPNGRTFYLGTKYYVDGGYSGGSSDGSWEHPWTSISTAVTNASDGNITIIVRGAHDFFDGIYIESSGFVPKTGGDDTHRWMIVGYDQERPIIDGNNSTADIIRSTTTVNAYVTIQRVKVQNSQGQGIRIGNTNTKLDRYFNLFDVEVYNTANDTINNVTDSNIYYLNADNGWIYHVTSHHSMGHCMKMGDGADNLIIEWSLAYECGYWDGMVSEKNITNWNVNPGTHPSGIDLPSDSGVDSSNDQVRYNIVYDTLFYGIQLRNTSSFSTHHNEVYNTPHFDDVPGAATGATGSPQVLIYGLGSDSIVSGSLYSNIIRDSSDASSSGIGVNNLKDGYRINIYNNLVYNNPLAEIYLYGYMSPAGSSRALYILNNTLWHNSDETSTINATANYSVNEVFIKNNILGQLGSNSTISLDTDITDYDFNLYYFPNGSRGDFAAAHDFAGGASTDPQFEVNPLGTYTWGKGNITYLSGAKNSGDDLSEIFTNDFNLTDRPEEIGWDIGAYELEELNPDLSAPASPLGIVVY